MEPLVLPVHMSGKHPLSVPHPGWTTWLSNRVDGELGNTMGAFLGKKLWTCSVSTQCSMFSWIHDSQFVVCLWVISRVKWLFLIVFSSFIVAVCGKDMLTSSFYHAGNKCPFYRISGMLMYIFWLPYFEPETLADILYVYLGVYTHTV